MPCIFTVFDFIFSNMHCFLENKKNKFLFRNVFKLMKELQVKRTLCSLYPDVSGIFPQLPYSLIICKRYCRYSCSDLFESKLHASQCFPFFTQKVGSFAHGYSYAFLHIIHIFLCSHPLSGHGDGPPFFCLFVYQLRVLRSFTQRFS